MAFGISAAAALGGAALVTGLYSANKASRAADKASERAAQTADAQTQLGYEQLDLAREQWEKGEARQAKLDPMYEQLMAGAVKDSDTARARSKEQWTQYQQLFQPIEGKMAATASNYDTAGRRDSAAAEAAATTSKAFDSTQQMQARGLQRAGVRIGSGRALTLANDNRLNQAKAMAGADIAARRAVEDRGIALVDNAARFGRNQTSTSLQAAGVGLQANGVAQNAGLSGAQAAAASLQPAISLMNAGSNNIGSGTSTLMGIASNQRGDYSSGLAHIGSAMTNAAYLYGRNANPGFSGTQAPAPIETINTQP